MTRRDRAAMVLALHYARQGRGSVTKPSSHAHQLERHARQAVNETADFLTRHSPCEGEMLDLWDALTTVLDTEEYMPRRLLRARLALYLRARLRADAGDCGKYVSLCLGCRTWLLGGGDRFSTHRQWDRWTKCDGVVLRRITPLWEQAATHGGGR